MVKNSELGRLFKKINIKKNDTVMIHGNLAVVDQKKFNDNKKNINFFFKELINYFGNKGTIIIPTFTYSYIKKKIYNLKDTPSEVGMFSEEFRKLKKTSRTKNPIFSVGVVGKNKNFFLKSSYSDCFGKNTVFDLLKKLDGKIVCLGCHFNRVTFTHYLEQMNKVDYRFFKKFKGTIVNGKSKKKITTSYYVRKMKKSTEIDLSKLMKKALKEKKIYISDFRRFEVISIKANDFYKIGKNLIKSDPLSLIKGQRI